MGSAVDPVALRRHLSVALPFRRAFSKCPVRCKAPVRSYYSLPLLETILPEYRLRPGQVIQATIIGAKPGQMET